MKPSEKVTDKMMLKAYSNGYRNNYEIAIVNLTNTWFNSTKRIFTIARSAGVGLELRDRYRDGSAKFLIYIGCNCPPYEHLFGEKDIAFIEADPEEIEQLYADNEYIKSDTLLFTYGGISHYRTTQDIYYQTAEFDLELLLEILEQKNQQK